MGDNHNLSQLSVQVRFRMLELAEVVIQHLLIFIDFGLDKIFSKLDNPNLNCIGRMYTSTITFKQQILMEVLI